MAPVKGTHPGDHTTAAIILEAAEELFGQFGFGKVTMEEIAARAGLGKASLYYYYRTKEELFQAVVFARYTIFESRIHPILESGASVDDRIRAYVEERFEFFIGLLSLHITDFNSFPKNRPLMRQMFGTFSAQELRLLARLFGEGKRSGVFDIESDEAIAEAFLHVMAGLRARFLRNLELPLEPSQRKELRRELLFVTDIFLRGISRTRKPEPSDRTRRSSKKQ